jgi:hypothetical protein
MDVVNNAKSIGESFLNFFFQSTEVKKLNLKIKFI